jgi:DNA repair protein RecN (Recombination protein N)
VEERLSLLYELMQRYGAASVEELIAGRNRLESLVTDATQLLSQVESAQKAVEEKERLFAGHCERLHRLRKEGAPGFASAIQEQLHALELDHALFRVGLEDCTPGADGGDSIRFLFSSTGHTPADVAKTASGGELSRIMLSIKAVMARFTHMPTLIFDEIDSGVSGSTADKMGSLVCAMGTEMQVFAITHLPQVAAKGHAHYLVSKNDNQTTIQCLGHEGRVQELARMLSGSTITPAAIANAEALLTT